MDHLQLVFVAKYVPEACEPVAENGKDDLDATELHHLHLFNLLDVLYALKTKCLVDLVLVQYVDSNRRWLMDCVIVQRVAVFRRIAKKFEELQP